MTTRDDSKGESEWLRDANGDIIGAVQRTEMTFAEARKRYPRETAGWCQCGDCGHVERGPDAAAAMKRHKDASGGRCV